MVSVSIWWTLLPCPLLLSHAADLLVVENILDLRPLPGRRGGPRLVRVQQEPELAARQPGHQHVGAVLVRVEHGGHLVGAGDLCGVLRAEQQRDVRVPEGGGPAGRQ